MAQNNTSLDVLKMIEQIAAGVMADVDACFYASGTYAGQLAEQTATKRLMHIRGKMQAMKVLVENSK